MMLGTQGLSTPTIAFNRVELRGGHPKIFVAASDGNGEHPLLPNPEDDYDAVWSPDGKSIVFTSERNGSADLYRVKPDGSGLKALTTDPAYDDQAAFSPDGQKLAWVRAELQDLKDLPVELVSQGPANLSADALRELLADAESTVLAKMPVEKAERARVT